MAGGAAGSLADSKAAPGNIAVARDLEGHEQAVQNVRNVGGKTFYLREGTWVDSEIKPEEEPTPNPSPSSPTTTSPSPHP